MGAGGVFILIAVIVVIALVAMVLTGNAGWLGWRGSDPQKQGAPGAEGSDRDLDKERPRHTVVNLEQNLQDEPHGEPLDRRP